jgi:hypothetical protein
MVSVWRFFCVICQPTPKKIVFPPNEVNVNNIRGGAGMIYQISLRIQMMEDKWVQLGEEHKMQWSNRDLVSASCGWTALNE